MKFSTLAIASLLVISSTGLALAQGAAMSGPPAGRGRMAACRDDAQKYCADKRGPDRRACLQSNMANLSDGCKTAMSAAGNMSTPSGGH